MGGWTDRKILAMTDRGMVDEWTNCVLKDGQMNGQRDEQMEEWTKGWTDEWTEGWTDGGWMKG